MKLLKIFLPALLLLEFTISCSQSSDSARRDRNEAAANQTQDEAGPATQEGSRMAYDYHAGRDAHRATWLFIHGLADDRTKLKNLAELAQTQGFGVLSIDLHGHGETLKEYLKSHSKLPEKMNYQENVRDARAIIQKLNLRELVIVGHSYGGGIAYSLASELDRSQEANVRSLHLLAPYVQRIDQFLREQMLSVNPFWRRPPEMGQNFQSLQDEWMDPYLQKYMERTYRDYVMESFPEGKNTKLTPAEKREVDFRVEAAIRTTKGIRSFDLLDETRQMPRIRAPLQILGGERDQLVLPAQLKKFEVRLKKEKVSYRLEFLDGSNATHLFPRLMPEETFRHILEFQKQEGLNL